jgi:hypothetical protein
LPAISYYGVPPAAPVQPVGYYYGYPQYYPNYNTGYYPWYMPTNYMQNGWYGMQNAWYGSMPR